MLLKLKKLKIYIVKSIGGTYDILNLSFAWKKNISKVLRSPTCSLKPDIALT